MSTHNIAPDPSGRSSWSLLRSATGWALVLVLGTHLTMAVATTMYVFSRLRLPPNEPNSPHDVFQGLVVFEAVTMVAGILTQIGTGCSMSRKDLKLRGLSMSMITVSSVALLIARMGYAGSGYDNIPMPHAQLVASVLLSSWIWMANQVYMLLIMYCSKTKTQ